MDRPLFVIADIAVTPLHLALAVGMGLVLVVLVLLVALARAAGARREDEEVAAERQEELDARMAELARASAELNGRMQTVAEVLGTRQADFARLVGERLDAVGHQVGRNLADSSKTSTENLGRLNERLAVIDAAQARLTDPTHLVPITG